MGYLRIFQKGFNFSQDGPGNRLVYHLQGCNLRCPWCSNPEGLELTGGREVSVEELLRECADSRLMFFEGGGVTLTGGEVTMQLDSVKELLSGLKELGIHTAIETNGLSPRLGELFDYLDCLMIDCKHYDAEKHRAVTGMGNRQLFNNLRRAADYGLPVALRIPLIGGFNDSEKDRQGFARLFRELGLQDKATIELLPYHEYGKDKYRSLSLPYLMDNTARIPPEVLRETERYFREEGFTLVHS